MSFIVVGKKDNCRRQGESYAWDVVILRAEMTTLCFELQSDAELWPSYVHSICSMQTLQGTAVDARGYGASANYILCAILAGTEEPEEWRIANPFCSSATVPSPFVWDDGFELRIFI